MSNRRKRDERAARAAQMRRDRERAEARRTRLITGSIVAVAVVLVVVVGVAVFASRGGDGEAPDGASEDFGFVYESGASDSEGADPVRVLIYEDFMCPICGALESQIGDYVGDQVDAGAIEVEYRPIAILDEESTTDYSTRATNAAACVADKDGVDAFHAFHDLLFDNQPSEGGAGLPDSELVGLAEQAGVTGVETCIEDGRFDDWVADATDQASQDNRARTPTVLVDGAELQAANPELGYTVQDLSRAVDEARAE